MNRRDNSKLTGFDKAKNAEIQLSIKYIIYLLQMPALVFLIGTSLSTFLCSQKICSVVFKMKSYIKQVYMQITNHKL